MKSQHMKKSMLKFFDYFFVLRPTLFFPVWTISMAGYWAQARFGESAGVTNSVYYFFDMTFVITLGLFTLLMGGIFLLNQLEDIETDRLNNKLYLIANGDISVRNARIETILVSAVPFLLAVWKRPDLAIVMAAAFFVMGWLYSSRPFVLKDRPFGGILANALGGYIVFFFGWMVHGSADLNVIVYATPYILGMLAVYFFTTIPDKEGDAATRKITVAVKFSVKTVLIMGVISDALAIVVGLCTKDWVILVPSILILPFFADSAIRKSVDKVLKTNKFAALFLSLVICIRFPFYLLLITGLFFFSKWYYKARFDMNYPSFRT